METIYHYLAAHAQTKANDQAFTFIEDNGDTAQISFSELHQNAQTIARYLAAQYQPGSRVVLLFPPGLEYIQAFLGCLYAGIVAVPLYPPQSKKHAGRVLTVIDDCQAGLVLTNNLLIDQIASELAPLPVVGFSALLTDEKTSENLTSIVAPSAEQIAFLQYTSGSTGTPKGVVVSHGNIVANLKALQQASICDEQDVFCNWLPLFHDLGLVNTLLLPIYLGAHSVLMSPVRFIKNPITWFKGITEYKATICGAPNFAFDHCLERIKPHQLAGLNLSSWRIAFNAAEPVDAETLMRFSDRFSRIGFKESAIFPAYGMAEATVFICGGAYAQAYTAYPFSSDALQKGKAQLPEDDEKQQILIAHGQVQAEHSLKIVSPDALTALPDGQVGEIWFAGPSLAQGYWNDSDKTNASFGLRLEGDAHSFLRTGDLGFIHDGELYISGRIKDVIIVKGRNYYPQDFEKLAYNIYPGLSQNGAAAFEVNGNAVLLLEVSRNMIKSFDYQHASETIQAAVFEQFEVVLEDILFVKAGRINRTSSGKIQRSLSKKRYLASDIEHLFSASQGANDAVNEEQAVQQPQQNVAAVSELEAQLCALWQEVFGIDDIGVEDNFLNLGGHSLLATTLIAQIQKKWQVEVSIRDFFTANTIRKLAAVMENASASQSPVIQPLVKTEAVSSSFAQERMWLVNQIEQEQAQYNLSFSLKLFGELNVNFLEQAFKTVINRHQTLRTTFQESDGQILQSVRESFEFSIPTIDLTNLSKEQQERQVATLGQEEAGKAFDLAEDLMLRVALLKLSEQSHIMLLTAHHIATDGWSFGVLTKELNAIYSALVHGTKNPLLPLDIQYIDYAAWQRNWLSESVLDEHLSYWKGQLKGLPVIHGLPLDKARPAAQSFKGAVVKHTIAQGLQEQLQALARQHDATLFMLLNAAFASFLNRYSGESDIVIGSPIANREQSEVAPLIGLFINNLVFRSDLSGDPLFTDVLQQSKDRTLAAYEHQQLPFEKLVDELQPQRNLSHSPLFQVMLILQNQEMDDLNLAGLEAKQLQLANQFAQYDLTLTLLESDNGLEMEWQYAADLFHQSTIERMVANFEVLLKGIVKAPNTKVSALPIMSASESEKLLTQWNNTSTDFPQDKCIHELFEQQVLKTPEAPAAVFDSETLSYEQLNQRANQLAHYLVQQGVTPDSVVGICLERSLDMLIGVLAIMKSGGAYLPMDPTYPKARLAYMLQDSFVNLVISQSHLTDLFESEDCLCLFLDNEDLSAEISAQEHANPDKAKLGLSATNLSYLIYTSGSTGKPKGVMLEHRNLSNFLSSMQKAPGLTSDDVLLAVTSLSFDIHALELYLPLMTGAKVVIASSENVASPEDLEQLIITHQVSIMQATPATWKMLLSNDWQPQNFSDKKFKVLCGGEALSTALKEQLLATDTIELWNMYGPTETAVWSATQQIKHGISLGGPIANTQFYVLDEKAKSVPVGVAGELYIGGAGVARGYLNRPELTQESFIPNPFSDKAGSRLYKTGDMVRWLSDGTLEYQRRVDLQVKVRGHRIELEEVETALKQHTQVTDAVVHVWDEGDSASLVAYVVTEAEASEAEMHQVLTEHLAVILPAYMIPGAFVCLTHIPLTPNGKTNRKALPKPNLLDKSEYVAPETATEKQLAALWQSLLNPALEDNLEDDPAVEARQFISANSNFFQLGGHSLLAARLVSLIRKEWQVDLSVRVLFTEQTLRSLARVIDESGRSQIPEILPVANKEAIPLSFAQKRLWFFDQLEDGRHQYNLCRGFQLTGELDVSALTQAFSSLIERHQVLRTFYQSTDSGEAIQVISSQFELDIPVVDLTEIPAELHQEKAREAIAEETQRNFDLNRDLMIRVNLLKFATDHHALFVTIHHIALDGWSERIIIDDLSALYLSQNANLLPAIDIQYGDYAWWQNQNLSPETLEPQLQFWTSRLEGLPDVHSLPLDRARPTQQSFKGRKFTQQLSAELQKNLKSLAQQYDASLFMLLNAAFATLLSRHSNEQDIVIGTPIANRDQAELAPLVGFFANTLVLRSDLSDNPRFEDLLLQSKEYLLAAYDHQQLPFEKLIEALQPERSLSYSPLFQVMMVMQNNEQAELALSGLNISEYQQQDVVVRHDLMLSVIENIHTESQGLTLSWEFASDLFDIATIKRMAGHFEVLLKGIMANPQMTVGELPLLSEPELQQVMDWNATQRSLEEQEFLHQGFELQTQENPDNVALVFEKQSLTYGELNAKANQLAYYLKEQNVEPEVMVGICAERSLEMVISMLAVLKAGGAYVPLDPGLPIERLGYMAQDSGVGIILTQQQFVSLFEATQQQLVCVDKFDEFANYPTNNIGLEASGLESSNLAYMIYTSGSTGKPKGVECEHRGIVNRLAWMQDKYQLHSEDRILQKTPYSFDVSIWEFFNTLGCGATLVLAKPGGHKEPEYLRELIQSQEISVIHFVPSMLAHMVASVPFSDLPSIRYVFCSGEALPKNLVEEFYATSGENVSLANLYGPTEASIEVSFWDCTPNSSLDIIPIGRAISNTQLYVLNPQLQPVPVGVAGELHIGGVGVARGYHNREDLTAEKFITDPFSQKPGARLYKTGDLARWLPTTEALAGNIEYIGRLDYQVKIRGFRIELGEIEAALQAHDAINEAIVVAHEDARADKQLVAYIVAKSQVSDEQRSELINPLRESLQQSLPEYMVPAVFMILEQFPLTSSGKVNRRLLPAPDFKEQLTSEFAAPETALEQQLSAIWQSLLKMDSADAVGRQDNFFELGGHSLLAVRLVSEIRAAFKVSVVVGDIFRAPTIAKQSALIEDQEAVDVSIIGKAPTNEPVALSFAQQSLWLIDQINPGQTQYNIPMALQLDGELNLEALTKAFEGIIERHQILRTTVQMSASGEAVQKVLENVSFTIPVIDLTDLSDDAQEETVLRSADEEANSAFDLSTDLMLRVKLLKLSTTTHVILVTMHHIASDGWSQSILLDDFNHLYRAYVGKTTDMLDELTLQYADYAWGQRQWMQGEVLDNYLGFWKGKLEGLPEVHNLPLDNARPVVQDNRGRIYQQLLRREVQEGLNALARKYDVTLFMVLSAAYSVLLSRHSGETDIVFGTPVANRDQLELTSLVGFFTNALVVRTDLSDNPDFTQLLQRSKDYLLGAYEHQQLPFEKLVDELQQQRNLSYSPLYQVKLALQNNELRDVDLPGLSFKKVERPHSVALHDLSLDVYELDDGGQSSGMELNWEYATSLFDEASIVRLADHFEVLLKGIIANPEANITELPVVTQQEKEQLLAWSKWSGVNTVSDKKQLTVVDMFQQQMMDKAGAVAALFDESAGYGESLTYAELNAKANQVAHYLIEQEVEPDTLVGLCVERSLEMVIGIWGILKAGAAYVPIDPDYPEKHIDHILEDSDIEIMLTSSELLSELPFDDLQILPLDDEMWDSFLGEYSGQNPEKDDVVIKPEHLAYVIYTSGSTGLPKGVTIEHKALAQSTLSRFDVYQEAPTSFALFSSFAFDSSVAGIFWTLVSGGKLCILDVKQGIDLTSFEVLMTKESISHFLTLPGVYQTMLSSDIQPGSALKTIIVAGEACELALVKQHQTHQHWQHARLVNEYGPTEACVWSSFYDCTQHQNGVVPIGITVPHAELFVLDNNQQLCPVGVTGELYVGGENLARGYLNQPQLSSDKFIHNPFVAGQRLYRTGDLVRCMPDTHGKPGNLEFIGRIDHQIKIRGFRIELGEIESAITQSDLVKDVVVLAKSLEIGQSSKQLVAYVVPKEIGDEDSSETVFRDELQIHLDKSLLSHKIPSVFVLMDKLPLTHNGKVDRKALQAKEVPVQLTQEYVAPQTETEKQICEIWQDLLKVKRIGIKDNFFAIGGDSILAIQAVTRAAKSGLVFTTRQVFDCQTIEKLAAETQLADIDSLLATETATKRSNAASHVVLSDMLAQASDADSLQQLIAQHLADGAINQEKANWFTQLPFAQLQALSQQHPRIEKLYPTTGMQQGMLYHSRLNSAAYVSQLSLELNGRVNTQAFRQALEAIVKRHDVFRTAFTDDLAHQFVVSEAQLDFNELNWCQYDSAEQQLRLEQFLKQDKADGFDIKRAPLMRITLIALSDKQFTMVWSSHHALSDGWSFPLLFKEVIELYEQATDDAQPLSVDVAEAPSFERYIEWLAKQDDDKTQAFWREQLASFEAPTAIHVQRKVRGNTQGPRKQWLNLGAEQTAQLQSLARHHKVTLSTVVQAAWAYLLHRYSGDEQLVFGETISGRPAQISGVEEIIGLFINSLPVSVNIQPEQEIGSWLQAMQKSSLDRVEHGYLPLSDIQHLAPVNSTTEGQELNLFDTLVVFENFPVDVAMKQAVVGSELSVGDVHLYEQTNYALTLSVLPENHNNESTLHFKLGYHAERFEESAIARLLAHYETILNGLISSMHTEVETGCKQIKSIADLPMVTAQEQQTLLVDWNQTTADYPKTQCIHQLFAEQVAANPDKDAIVDAIAVALDDTQGTQKLSFEQLYERSQALALYLQDKGVTPDTLVGICIDRTPEMMIGIMGILMAGGAYLPMDPDYPEERLSYMLQDSKATLVLTSEKHQDKLSPLTGAETQLLTLDADWSEIDDCVVQLKAKQVILNETVSEDNLAYVIYTSGSTGQPKGVMIEHRMVVDYCYSVFNKMNLAECDSFATVSTFAADLGNIALFVPLIFSKTLHLFGNAFVNQPAKLKQYLEHYPIDCMKITPSHFEMFRLADDEIVASSKVMIFAGEPLTIEIVETVNRLQPSCRVFNNYGPTETTISKLSSDALNEADLSTIYLGKPLDNAQVFVLDKYNRPAPVGVPGELHIAGDGVARGYFNRPELSAEKFVSNPFSDGDAPHCERMYKTGDLVRWSEGGNIEYLGRIDNQVKIRGFRIEVGEIEAQLNSHSGVKESVVVVQGDEGDKQLIAFYVPVSEQHQEEERYNGTRAGAKQESDKQEIEDELKAYLLASLPDYMVPTAFVNLESVPLNHNGKTDRRALENTDVTLQSGESYVAPRNETEAKLVEIWAEVLDLDAESIGMNDNFFELGGHSLKATRLIGKVSFRMEIELPLEALFDLPTIAGMSEFIHAAHYQLNVPSAEEGSLLEDGDDEEIEEGTL